MRITHREYWNAHQTFLVAVCSLLMLCLMQPSDAWPQIPTIERAGSVQPAAIFKGTDPGIEFSTFMGGTGDDRGRFVALDADDNIVIAGLTRRSLDFPTTPGAVNATPNPRIKATADLVIVKLSADGGTVLFSAILGGSAVEDIGGLALDGDGNIVIAGMTRSPDFPTTVGAMDRTLDEGDQSDAYVLKLSADGSHLLFSTLLGGTDRDGAQALVVDDTGNIVIAGFTDSEDFPITPGAFQTEPLSGGLFVTKLSADGSRLLFSTLFGGTGSDIIPTHEGVLGMTIDPDGNVVITGHTNSTDFPTTATAFQATRPLSSSADAFVAKLAADGTELLFSTYLGGQSFDAGTDVALTTAGEVVVTGATQSTDFPTTEGAFDTTVNHGWCRVGGAFVTMLTADGSALLFSTFLGGSEGNNRCPGIVDFAAPGPLFIGGQGLAIDPAGNIVLTGTTSSSDFPTTEGALDRSFNGESRFGPTDAYVATLSHDGTTLLHSTFIGGADNEFSRGLALTPDGQVVITGTTFSTDFPRSPNAFDTSFNGESDFFITKLDLRPFEIDAADLTGAITKFKMKLNKKGNEILRFKVKVGNLGNRKAKGPFTVTAFLSEDEVLDEMDDELLKTWTVPQLRKGDIVKLKGKIKDVSLATDQFLFVVLDADDEIGEVDETNNVVSRQIPATH